VKQFLKIALLVIYLIFNAGTSYSMHYCGDEFQWVNIFADSKTCCPSQEPMPGCCDDVSHLELPNTDQQLSDAFDFQTPAFLEFSTVGWENLTPSSVLSIKLAFAYADSSPPLISGTPLFVLFCNFLI
jgi:hypothetical protein